ncbi:hypothetical protein N7495_003883 [Penicillium taxi]|uniref:uncharacterized protein n=1 Tax=Penicillium taxi TaxID=168475 RepID=UPI0025458A15|nr:uncharacterized protein N7495_003883 [Penicillium taxi]KAJ5899139.1 hypothetical protein N7495_003883 [Penicillium taxi]
MNRFVHKFVVPRKSGVHRFACLALYRALLRQCSPAKNTTPLISETKFVVKQQFRRYKSLQSPSQVVNALKAGYEVFDILDSVANGSEKDAQQLSSILTQAKAIKEKYAVRQKKVNEQIPQKPLTPRQARKAETIRFEKATMRRNPNTRSILERPYAKISGIRRVPVLVNARGLPFLRIKKPQPRNLSSTIRNKLAKRWHRIETRERLDSELLFARDEDAWDRLTGTAEEFTWAEEVKTALGVISDKIKVSDRQNRELAQKLWQVVLAERKLAEKEKAERQALKRARKQEAKQNAVDQSTS